MKVYRIGGSARLLLRAALCASALASSAAPALPQRGKSNETMIRERNADMLRELEIKRRDGTVSPATPQPPPHPALPYALSREDFRTLQLVNNEIMRVVFAAGAPAAMDYERVATAAAEINKRASRLKSNLKLPDPSQKAARPLAVNISNDEHLRASLLTLDGLIMGFVTNPAFRDPGIVDGRHSAIAAETLTRVIELSRAVRLSAEKMRKARKGAR